MREWNERNIPLSSIRSYRVGGQLMSYFSVPDPKLATLEYVPRDVATMSRRVEAVGPDGAAKVLKDSRGTDGRITTSSEPSNEAMSWRVGKRDWDAVLDE